MKILLILTSLLTASVSFASVETGEPAPYFTLMSASGEEVSLSDYSGKFVVLEWFNHGCPFVAAQYDSGNLPALQKKYTDQDVVWLSIASSASGKQGSDSPEGHLETAEEKGAAPTAILLDESGEVGKMYGARTTPHMYVIDPEGMLIYQGAIDDSPRGNPRDAENYVSNAIDQAKAGEEITNRTTRPYGCGIKYAK